MTDKILIIAEAGVNHNGDLDMAKRLVDVAVAAGADIVKFQSFRADKLASRNAPKAEYQIVNADKGIAETQYEMLKRLELSDEAHEILIDYCKKKNIEFLSTPFDIDGLHMLIDRFKLQRIKLGSSELTNAPMLLEAAKAGKQVILSTGMSTLEEVRDALGVLAFGYLNSKDKPTRENFLKALAHPAAAKILKEKVIVMHCTTQYPTPYKDANLKAMQTMAEHFGIPVGYSDHTLSFEISIAAAAMGACVIEKHFTLSRTLPGPDHKASLEPNELLALVSATRNVEQALGNGIKAPAPSEMKNIGMARKSLVAARDIAKGEVFSTENITIKRPGNGPSPYDYWEMLGQTAKKAYKQDDPL